MSIVGFGRVPEWPKGADCKSVVTDFGGSNPPSPTRKEPTFVYDKCGFFSAKSVLADGINPPAVDEITS